MKPVNRQASDAFDGPSVLLLESFLGGCSFGAESNRDSSGMRVSRLNRGGKREGYEAIPP